MDTNIKNYIINNFKDDNIKGIKKAIDSSINENDEETLPGLGVFMELIWNESDDDFKTSLLRKIKHGIDSNIKEPK